jgi:hypothetical protein
MADKIDVLSGQFLGHIGRADSSRQAHNVFDLTALSFLVDQKIATVEDIAQRTQQVRDMMTPDSRSSEVAARVDSLMNVLRHVYGPKPRGWTPVVIEGGLNLHQNSAERL